MAGINGWRRTRDDMSRRDAQSAEAFILSVLAKNLARVSRGTMKALKTYSRAKAAKKPRAPRIEFLAILASWRPWRIEFSSVAVVPEAHDDSQDDNCARIERSTLRIAKLAQRAFNSGAG